MSRANIQKIISSGKSERENLNNITFNKTRIVNDYINNLPIPLLTTIKATEYYNNIKIRLKLAFTCDEKLMLIGYRPNNHPKMYDKINELNKV
jgi:hypothetical protein